MTGKEKRNAVSSRAKRKPVRGTRSSKEIPNTGRHESQCSICRHESRQEIDNGFTSWASPNALAKTYNVTRDAIYRHAHATKLFDARRRNIRAALERIIESAGDVQVNANAVVSAVQALAKINANGQWVDRTETVNLNDLFSRMSTAELKEYAESGRLPVWFAGATGSQGQEIANDA
jgi:hypothetical protein